MCNLTILFLTIVRDWGCHSGMEWLPTMCGSGFPQVVHPKKKGRKEERKKEKKRTARKEKKEKRKEKEIKHT